MATTTQVSSSASTGATDRQRNPPGRGGQRSGHSHQGPDSSSSTAENRSRGGGNARGRGRGIRGGRNRGNSQRNEASRHDAAHAGSADAENSQPPPLPGGVFGGRLTKDAANLPQGEVAGPAPAEGDDVEAEVCFICASPVAHNSVAPCNHRTCHICALRLRALYKTKACAHCRAETATVIFTDDAEKRFEDFEPTDFFKLDPNLGINYEKPEIFEDTVLLLRYNCPDETCDVACLGWPDLHRHVRSAHQKRMCDLCTRNKKVFTHEHELFTPAELRRHEQHGDDNPGAIDQSGFKGHPECGFCRQRFYGDDELFAHCRDKHERCHVCDRRNGGQNPQYFVNYEALEKHFNKDHYPCLDPECLEKKFVVFDSQMDLSAHQLEAHPNSMSKDVRRSARHVDISAFPDMRQQYLEPTTRGRGNRRAGRGRDPNAEHMAPPSTGHLSRAELAHQREREIHSAQSVSARSFGGQLSQPDPPLPSHRQPQRQQANNNPAVDGPASDTTPRPQEDLSPEEQRRRRLHAAVIERASGLCGHDKVKMDEFRERISAYRTNSISAGDLIDAFFALFDTTSDKLGTLIRELADIYENPAKRDALVKAWVDWKAINEDYPSLPGPSGANTTASGVLGQGVGASRVLKLKSSTAKSSKANPGRQAVWSGSSSAAPSSSSAGSAFPSLPSRGAPAASAATPSNAGWLSIRPASARPSPSTSSSSTPRLAPMGSAARAGSGDAFPALPAAKKPTSTVFSPGYRGAGVIRVNSGMPVNAWAAGALGDAEGLVSPPPEEVGAEGAGKKKGNKGKKQLVMQWG